MKSIAMNLRNIVGRVVQIHGAGPVELLLTLLFSIFFSLGAAEAAPALVSQAKTVGASPLWEGHELLNSGHMERLKTFKTDAPTVYVFLSDSCPCSLSHMDHFKSLQGQFPDIQFFGVHAASHKDLKKVSDFYSSKELNFTVVADPEQKLVKRFKALRTPHVFFIEKDKTLFAGSPSNDANFPSSTERHLLRALGQFESGEEIKPKMAKLHGCYIEQL